MKRHPIDQTKPRLNGARLTRFLRLERSGMPRPATVSLQRRPADLREGRMLKAFAMVERRNAI
ncbi:hypothetical protein ACMU_01240 [Actibacterium mucosum KCTC 23349]|uniref:Uncharacterized protein n=1 Tax=Actibacterium mucosum KCTC 23349 TaxID=1454373 RepID=A0A037ZL19_9RHOB|nr:hypothetical protein [Actibacterium mucosum]KAJ57146.1 hypothetical protein ACMU_01240 [Actibacterium mucosum KCTC 23349]